MDSTESTSLPRSHSKLGITVFILSLLPWATLACYLTFVLIDVTYLKLNLTEYHSLPTDIYMIAAPLCALLALVSLGLGIGAFFQKGYRKVLPILGMLLALVSCLLWLVMALVVTFFYIAG